MNRKENNKITMKEWMGGDACGRIKYSPSQPPNLSAPHLMVWDSQPIKWVGPTCTLLGSPVNFARSLQQPHSRAPPLLSFFFLHLYIYLFVFNTHRLKFRLTVVAYLQNCHSPTCPAPPLGRATPCWLTPSRRGESPWADHVCFMSRGHVQTQSMRFRVWQLGNFR